MDSIRRRSTSVQLVTSDEVSASYHFYRKTLELNVNATAKNINTDSRLDC